MFYLALVFILIMVIGLPVAFLSKKSETQGGGILMIAVGFVLGGICLIAACLSTVPARNVGIVTGPGDRPTGRITGAGIQWTAPWQNVQDWDATKQIYDHGTEKTCVQVRIAGGGTGCVEVRVEWRSGQERGPENFATYRAVGDDDRFATFTNRRVNPQITASMASIFSTFDPLAAVSTTTGLAAAPDLNSLYRQKLTDAVNTAIGGGPNPTMDNPRTKAVEDDPNADIVVQGVTFGYIHYDDATNSKLTSYAQKLLDARNLQVDKSNAALREQIANQSGVPAAVQQCLDLIKTQGKGEPGLCMGGQVALTKPIG